MVDNFTRDVAGIIPGVLATGLAVNTLNQSMKTFPKMKNYSNNRKMQYKNTNPFSLKKTNISPKPIVRGAVGALIGVPLIGATASAVNRL